MPTTQPLDDELGDIAEGQLKSIAGFAQPGARVTGEPPRAKVPHTTPAPKQTVNASANPRIGHNLKMPGVGINGPRMSARNIAEGIEKTSARTPQHKGRNNSYDDTAVNKAWLSFIETNKAEHLLTNAMKAVTPHRHADDTFLIAQSSVHLGYIRENLPRITTFVRDSIGNDNISFILEEVSEDNPSIWNEREVFKNMIENNESFAAFIKDLGLTLS